MDLMINVHIKRAITLAMTLIFSAPAKNPLQFFRKGESGSLTELISIPKAQEAMVSIVILCQYLPIKTLDLGLKVKSFLNC